MPKSGLEKGAIPNQSRQTKEPHFMRERLICESSYSFSNHMGKKDWQQRGWTALSWLHIIATLQHPKSSKNKCKERQLIWMFNALFLDTDNNPSEEHVAAE